MHAPTEEKNTIKSDSANAPTEGEKTHQSCQCEYRNNANPLKILNILTHYFKRCHILMHKMKLMSIIWNVRIQWRS